MNVVVPRANHLLSALPNPAYQQWAALLEELDMPLGQVLYESGGPFFSTLLVHMSTSSTVSTSAAEVDRSR
ncbi:MAG: hypothetical protein H7125_09640 [Proteobacteria bacterium]|nr:hypothetical protein [Burkholderiales bacterium]